MNEFVGNATSSDSSTGITIGESSPMTQTGYSGFGGGSLANTTFHWTYPYYPVGPYYGWSYPTYPPVTVITYPATSPELERKLDDLTEEVRKLRKELKKERNK